MTDPEKPFIPFWATPQYGGGLMQGIGLTLFFLFLLNSISAGFFDRYAGMMGIIGITLAIAGSIQVRRRRR
jgi:hypothetical protein